MSHATGLTNSVTTINILFALNFSAPSSIGAFHAVYVVADVGLDARHEIGDSPGVSALFQWEMHLAIW